MSYEGQPLSEFVPFPKIARLYRDIVITEKIDGTNAQVVIGEDSSVRAASRSRFIAPQDDNFGFARWVEENREDLLQLGPGRHYGEWWGNGIQRGYGLAKGEKRFSLFNVKRWADEAVRPSCVSVVPVLYTGRFSEQAIIEALMMLESRGSVAAPGFMKPEGVIVFHTASGVLFKKTLEKDEAPKGQAE